MYAIRSYYGLSEIISAFEVKCIIISKIPDYCVPDDINYNEIMMECKNNNIEIKQPYDDEIISMGEAEITLFTRITSYNVCYTKLLRDEEE